MEWRIWGSSVPIIQRKRRHRTERRELGGKKWCQSPLSLQKNSCYFVKFQELVTFLGAGLMEAPETSDAGKKL